MNWWCQLSEGDEVVRVKTNKKSEPKWIVIERGK